MRNYFKASGVHFFFNDNDADDTLRAFELADAVGTEVSMWKVPEHAGPWDRVGVIGHRLRGEILAELGVALEEDVELLTRELAMLDHEYLCVGRLTVPPQLVAA